jgi:hypothetical protein
MKKHLTDLGSQARNLPMKFALEALAYFIAGGVGGFAINVVFGV